MHPIYYKEGLWQFIPNIPITIHFAKVFPTVNQIVRFYPIYRHENSSLCNIQMLNEDIYQKTTKKQYQFWYKKSIIFFQKNLLTWPNYKVQAMIIAYGTYILLSITYARTYTKGGLY